MLRLMSHPTETRSSRVARGATRTVGVVLSAEECEAIDRARGDRSVSAWLRGIVRAALSLPPLPEPPDAAAVAPRGPDEPVAQAVARMAAAGMPQAEVARLCGVSRARVGQVWPR